MNLKALLHGGAGVLGIVAAVVAFAQTDLPTVLGLASAAIAANGAGHFVGSAAIGPTTVTRTNPPA